MSESKNTPSLPNNIDAEILNLTTGNTAILLGISEGWKAMAETILNLNKEIEELKEKLELADSPS